MTPVRFGTDGIRGVAGETITEELAAALGHALGSHYPGGTILIGRDTRESGERLSAALAAGVIAGGANPVDVGVIPTSGLAIITARDASIARAVAVTASHNPAEYNGLKVIARNGRKIPDDEERALEEEIERLLGDGAAAANSRATGDVAQANTAGAADAAEFRQRYVALLAEAASDVAARGPMKLRVVVDAAHGAGAPYALEALTLTGAEVIPFAMGGGAINDAVGATAPAALAHEVLRKGADLGVALDGDADRCVAVDESGTVVDGDVLIALIALDRRARGLAGSDRVVATVLTNSGVERALAAAGIRLVRTPVGDRHIAEALDGASEGFGGEKSGHLLFAERAPTGDGLLSAIELISLIARSGRSLASLAAEIPLDPQIQVAVRVPQGWAELLLADPTLTAAIRAAAPALEASGGRLLLRASGTEPLLRVMAEGPDAELVRRAVDAVTAAAEALLRGR
ncbi:MAG: phosphoglucosamine mutase [Candidatus Limnocylindrus sp.]